MTLIYSIVDGGPPTIVTSQNASSASLATEPGLRATAEGFMAPAAAIAEKIVTGYGNALHQLADS